MITGFKGLVIIVGMILIFGGPESNAAPLQGEFAVSGKEMPPGAVRAGGDWKIVNDTIQQAAITTKTALCLFGDKDWNNYSARVRVQFDSPGADAEAGLVLQARDRSNYLVFSLTNRQDGPLARLRIVNEKGISEVGDQSRVEGLDLTQWHELSAEVHDAQVACYLDGKPVANFWFAGTPPAYNTHGKTWEIDPEHGQAGLIIRFHSGGPHHSRARANFKDLSIKPLKDFSRIITPQSGRRDAAGMMLPRQSYHDTMMQFTNWMLNSEKFADYSAVPPALHKLPPYLVANFIGADDKPWGLGGEFAFNHALLITGSVQAYTYSGNPSVLKIAQYVANWHLANRTPADWKFPYAPPSMVAFAPDGTWKGQDWGLEPDKSAYMGIAYLKLYAVTNAQKYLQAAQDIAGTLRKYQQADGSWPFRINAQTGEIKHGYACSQLWYVWFFNQLADISGDRADRVRAKKALDWLLAGPVKDDKWIGLYGDIASGTESYDQWVALETAMYLLDHRGEHADAVKIAQHILGFVKEKLVVDYGFHPGVPGVIEQTEYRIVLTHHQLRLAELYAKLFEATGNEAYKKEAIQTANSVTWCFMSDGKMRQGFWAHAVAVPMILSFNEQFCRIMACVPETAPKGENHLLQATSNVKSVKYENKAIEYETVGRGHEILTVKSKPQLVKAGTVVIPELESRDIEKTGLQQGWWKDPHSDLLYVWHLKPEITITLP